MRKVKRHLDEQLKQHFAEQRQVILLLGSRQVGKTTILKRLFPSAQHFILDNDPARENFSAYDINSYRQFINPNSKYIIIDEIQLLEDPGRAAKIIYDQLPEVKLIITGSAALNIKNRTSESLAGRKVNYHLYPLTFSEYLYQTEVEESLSNNFLERIIEGQPQEKIHMFDLSLALERILTYGLHPYLVEQPENEEYLTELADSEIYKDIFELNLIENQKVAANLLKLLAYQVGNLINYSELADRLAVDVRTVKRYINIFEESFIIFQLPPFTSRRRDEIGKATKVYFYDIGLRNAVIKDFSTPRLRRDYGALFESFIIAEVMKYNEYFGKKYELAYWRTAQGAEVDLVLHNRSEVIGCEIKASKGKVSRSFTNRFPKATTRVITANNFY